MIKIKIINFSLLFVCFLLLISLLKIIIFYEINKNYTLEVLAQSRPVSSRPQSLCLYLKWETSTWPESSVVPRTNPNNDFQLGPSPIKVSGPSVGIGVTQINSNFMLEVAGTTSVKSLCFNGQNCRSDWPVGVGSDYWILNQSQGQSQGFNFIYTSPTVKRVSIGSSTVPTTTLHVFGNVTADSFLGTINAANISSGIFASLTGGGNFSFPASLSVNTTSLVLPSVAFGGDNKGLNVEGTIRAAKRLCIGNTCYENWPTISAIPVKIPFNNGLLYEPTTSWPAVYPVVTNTFITRPASNQYPYYPYLKFIEVIERIIPENSPATTTPWFDLFYGYHNINEPGYDKALYVEESDNSYPLSYYAGNINETMTCGSKIVFKRKDNNCNDLFGGVMYYDSNGVLHLSRNEEFIINKCFNADNNDGCRGLSESRPNLFSSTSRVFGRVALELRVVGWQRPSSISESDYPCSNIQYIPNMLLQSWNKPSDVFFKITSYRRVSSNQTNSQCVGAMLRSKIQGRFVVIPIKGYDINGNEQIWGPSSLKQIANYLKEQRQDFWFVFKEAGLSILTWVRN